MGGERKLVAQFDKNGDGWLNTEERKAARESAPLQTRIAGGRWPRRTWRSRRVWSARRRSSGWWSGGGPQPREPAQAGPAGFSGRCEAGAGCFALRSTACCARCSWSSRTPTGKRSWPTFKNTDVEVPATLTVDGKKYPNVGVHFRGMSSYMMVPAGYKRSLNVSLDFVDAKQRLYGYKTLNLLNAHDDPSFLNTVLYSHIARQYIPAPKANFVKVVINGESWGVYANVQQFNKEFLAENFKTTKGARWKVQRQPRRRRRAGLPRRQRSRTTSAATRSSPSDDEKAWKALIKLCKTLNETPPDKLEEALKPMLDIDGLLWFLALDIALINSDGYWIRASDYSLYRDAKGKFHIIPHDMNEAFHPGGGPGFGGPGPGGPGGPGGSGPRRSWARPGAGPGGSSAMAAAGPTGARSADRPGRRPQAAAQQAAGRAAPAGEVPAERPHDRPRLARLEEARPAGAPLSQADREGGRGRHPQAQHRSRRSSGRRATKHRRAEARPVAVADVRRATPQVSAQSLRDQQAGLALFGLTTSRTRRRSTSRLR